MVSNEILGVSLSALAEGGSMGHFNGSRSLLGGFNGQ